VVPALAVAAQQFASGLVVAGEGVEPLSTTVTTVPSASSTNTKRTDVALSAPTSTPGSFAQRNSNSSRSSTAVTTKA